MLIKKDFCISVRISRIQGQWIRTLSKRVNISAQKLLKILMESKMIADKGVPNEQVYETLAKRVGISREKLDELNLVKKELRKKRNDQKQRVQYFIQFFAEDKLVKSMSEHIRLLIEMDMLDLDSTAYIFEKVDEKKMDLELKHLKENSDMFENTFPMFRNKQGA